MATNKTVTKDTWYIAKDDKNIHHGKCNKGTRLDSGLNEVLEYDNESDWLEELKRLEIEVDEEMM